MTAQVRDSANPDQRYNHTPRQIWHRSGCMSCVPKKRNPGPYAVEIAARFGAQVRKSNYGLWETMAEHCIRCRVSGVRLELNFVPELVLAEFSGFSAPCAFEFVFQPTRLAIAVDQPLPEDSRSPFPVFGTGVDAHMEGVCRLFADRWEEWRWCRDLGAEGVLEIAVCDHQCTALILGKDAGTTCEILERLAGLLAAAPFSLLKRGAFLSRYTDLGSVRIDEANVPPPLRPLIPFVREWCLTDEAEIERYQRRVGRKKAEAFVRAFEQQLEALNHFWNYQEPGRVPDEVTAFQIAGQAFALLASGSRRGG